jgi:hypothetical protein
MKLSGSSKSIICVLTLFVISCSQESTFTARSGSKSTSSSVSYDALGNVIGDLDEDGIPDVLGDENGDGIADSAGGSAKVDGLVKVDHCDIAKERGYLKTSNEIIEYKANFNLGAQCKWEEMKNGHIRGYKEWPKTFSVNSERVLCKMEFDSNKELQFDDSLVLTLNDNILFWGNVQEEVFTQKDGIYQYDWKKIYDSSMGSVGGGCVMGATTCVIPSHDTPGAIKLAFNDDLNDVIMKDVEDKGALFTLRAFGDNDDAVDCSHTGVELNVTYTYFEK